MLFRVVDTWLLMPTTATATRAVTASHLIISRRESLLSALAFICKDLVKDARLEKSGRPGGNRTPNLRFWRPPLCQLSYWPSKHEREMGSRPISRLYSFRLYRYSMILATTPAPTVRPPSRIAKRRPSSIAMGAISDTFSEMLSPGITISTPSGRSIAPVTSVVRK